MGKTIDPRIFRAYDIRGKVVSQITAEACRAMSRAFGTILQERYGISAPAVCVGRDARLTSHTFEDAVVHGLMEVGCQVLRIGQTPSPVNYFTICTQKLDGGVHVTASHNPADDNGLKLTVRDAEPFAGKDIQELRQRCEEQQPLTLTLSRGERESQPLPLPFPQGEKVEDTYTACLTTLFTNIGKGLHVVIDAGNGVAGPLYTRILRAVGCTVTELYTEPDGRFPNHPADPSKWDTLRELQEKVRVARAHVGLAFDGDGDRLGLVDEQGQICTADQILLLLAHDYLSRFPRGKVVFTVSNSSIIPTEVARWGGIPIMCPVGHSSVEHAMRAHGALLGGEQSGHFFCAEDYYPFDDAIVTSLRILAILQHEHRPLSVLLQECPTVFQAQERRPFCPDDAKAAIIERVKQHFLQRYPVETMDGVRIDFGEGAWAGIRQSNTSPCISICMEARDAAKLREIEDIVLHHLYTYPEVQFEKMGVRGHGG